MTASTGQPPDAAGALVGPLPQITFHDRSKQVYIVPADTRDPRYKACTDHHPACDCREAHLSEDINEWRGEYLRLKKYEEWARVVALLHQCDPNPYVGDRCNECNVAWPCPTWRLTAEVDFGAQVAQKYHAGRVDA